MMAKIYNYYMCLLVFTVLHRNSDATCHDAKKNMNGGTVLFTESDNTKQCWSSESIALLTSRMILEDVLPSPQVLKMNSEDFVADVVDYFRMILEIVREVTYGKTKHIMLLAVTDLLGGYLNSLVLPIAKYAYYAGHINYESTEKLYQLFDELKCFLRTNGQGWKKGVKVSAKHANIEPIPLETPSTEVNPCEGLITYDKSPEEETPNKKKKCEVEIPMPFFDSKSSPSAVAIPFKKYSLRNIQSKAAAYVVLKYYVAATKCLMTRNANSQSLHNFNNQLYSWLTKYVMPRLSDDKFYSAFGGVLRILETLKKKGGIGESGSKTIGSYNIMPEIEEHEPPKDEEGVDQMEKEAKHRRFSLVLLALLCAIFLLFLLGSLFICYRIRTSKNRKDTCAESGRYPSSKGSTKGSRTSTEKSRSQKFGFSFGATKDAVRNVPCKMFRKDTDEETLHSDTPKTSTKSGKSSKPFVSKSRTTKSSEDKSKKKFTTSSLDSDTDRSRRKGSRSPRLTGSRTSGTIPKLMSSSTASKGIRSSLSTQEEGFCEPCGSESVCRTICVEQVDRSAEADFPEDENQPEFYAATYACHTSMGGRYRPSSSTDDATSNSVNKNSKVPFVFGYDFETTSSESSPRGTSEGDTDFKGNMSK